MWHEFLIQTPEAAGLFGSVLFIGLMWYFIERM